jgi:hypothetical protein
MSSNDDFRVRPGRIRSTRGLRTKSFLVQALKAAQKVGGLSRGTRSSSSRFGRGLAASLAASRMLQARGRGAMVKARVVRDTLSYDLLRAGSALDDPLVQSLINDLDSVIDLRAGHAKLMRN